MSEERYIINADDWTDIVSCTKSLTYADRDKKLTASEISARLTSFAGETSVPNGRAWYASNLALDSDPLDGPTYENGLWRVVIGKEIYYSVDGAEWVRSNLAPTNDIKGIRYNDGLWVVWSSYGEVWCSTDLIEWTKGAVDSCEETSWVDMAYGNGCWMACSDSYNSSDLSLSKGGVWTSTDALTWTKIATPFAAASKVIWSDGIWLASTRGTNGIYRSIDGAEWLSVLSCGSYYMQDILYVNGMWFTYNSTASKSAWCSSDGSTWAQIPGLTFHNFIFVKYCYDRWIFSASSNNSYKEDYYKRIYWSRDGVTWTSGIDWCTGRILDIIYADGLYYVTTRDYTDPAVTYATADFVSKKSFGSVRGITKLFHENDIFLTGAYWYSEDDLATRPYITGGFKGFNPDNISYANDVWVTYEDLYYKSILYSPGGKTATVLDTCNEVTSYAGDIAANAFRGCTALIKVDVPNATAVGDNAFRGCTSLASINLQKAVTIGARALHGCVALTAIELPEVTGIADGTFQNCTALANAVLPAATTVGDYAFLHCAALTSISLPETTTVGHNAFTGCTSLAFVDAPKAETVGEGAFTICPNLTDVNIPNVTAIGNYAFHECASLTSIDMPNVTAIGSYVFNGCTALTEVVTPNVTSIGDHAFMNCSSITMIDLPVATKISSWAFSGCTALTAVVLRSETAVQLRMWVPGNYYEQFTNTPIARKTGYIYVPSALIDTYKAANGWSTYATQFRALEDYTVDGTTTGDLDESKIST